MAKVGSYHVDIDLKGLSQAQAGLAGLRGSFGKLGSVVKGFAIAGTGALAAGFVAAGVAGVKLAAQAESTAVQFRVLTGSVESANKVMGDLQAFAASTPFQFPELAGAARKLIAFGFSADGVVDSLRSVGDIASGVGAPIGEISELFGKARVQGRLFAEDVNQLVGRGIPVIQEFAKQLGVADSEVKQMVAGGAIGFENLERAFKSLTSEGGKFSGLMDAMSQTTEGLFSTLKDNVNAELRELGEKLLPSIKSALEGLNAVLDARKGGGQGDTSNDNETSFLQAAGAWGQAAAGVFYGLRATGNRVAGGAAGALGYLGSEQARMMSADLMASARQDDKSLNAAMRSFGGLPEATSDEVVRLLRELVENTNPAALGREPLTVGR